MRYARLLPLAALAFAAACNEATNAPMEPSFKASNSNAHFIASATSAVVSPNPDLLISFKIAGVGAGVTLQITAQATAHLFQDCVNGGGKQPSAANKHFDPIPVADNFPATADAGGNIVASHTLLFPETSLNCPPGQDLITEGYWSDISISTSPVPSSGQSLLYDNFPNQLTVSP